MAGNLRDTDPESDGSGGQAGYGQLHLQGKVRFRRCHNPVLWQRQILILQTRYASGRKAGNMAKVFAVTVILIAIASEIPILLHTWEPPVDISTHGPLIDEQMSETMAEAGISFLAAQIILGILVWKFTRKEGP